MATIREIAELAGVSRGTVDRVLNNRGSVNPATEKRILEIAERLDYKPNRAALVLAAQKKNIRLGVILFGKGNPFFEDVVSAMRQKEAELSEYNCQVLIRWTDVDEDDQLRAIDSLLKEGVTGIAISPTNSRRLAKRIDDLYAQGIYVVTLNTDITDCKRLAYVGSNYLKTGATAAGLLRLAAGQGGEPVEVGIISGSAKILCHTERIAGFSESIRKNPRFTIAETIVNDEDERLSYERTTEMLRRFPKINALFFAASGIAGGCRAVIDAKRQTDMTIVTYDAVPETIRLVKEGIISATICQQPEIQGSLPLELLFDCLATGEMPRQEYFYTNADIRIRENLEG